MWYYKVDNSYDGLDSLCQILYPITFFNVKIELSIDFLKDVS